MVYGFQKARWGSQIVFKDFSKCKFVVALAFAKWVPLKKRNESTYTNFVLALHAVCTWLSRKATASYVDRFYIALFFALEQTHSALVARMSFLKSY